MTANRKLKLSTYNVVVTSTVEFTYRLTIEARNADEAQEFAVNEIQAREEDPSIHPDYAERNHLGMSAKALRVVAQRRLVR